MFFRRCFIIAVASLIISISQTAAAVNPTSPINIDTLGTEVDLPAVNVKARKEHYSKRNNPAVELQKQLRDLNKQLSPFQTPFYSYRQYDNIVIGLDKFSDSIKSESKFAFLNSVIDSSAVASTRYLPLSVKERASLVLSRNKPATIRTLIDGLKSSGVDDIFERDNIITYIDDVFREIDIFNNDIVILGNRFVSPLSTLGPDFYRYYIGDTIQSGGEALASLDFIPRNNAFFGFSGRIWYDPVDSLKMIRGVDMKIPGKTNINFIENFAISQRYSPSPNGYRLKTRETITGQLAAISGTRGIIIIKSGNFSGHNFEQPANTEIFERSQKVFTTPDAWLKDDDFWHRVRPRSTSLTDNEMTAIMSELRSIKQYKWSEILAKIIVQGYIPTGNPSKIDIGPVNAMLSFNDIEGTRFRLGGMTTAKLNNHVFLKGYGAYGTRDHKWKYNAEIEYSFLPKENHAAEFPVHSIRGQYKFDTYGPGQHYAFTSPDNIFLSLRREKDTLQLYERKALLAYKIETFNDLSFELSGCYRQFESSRGLSLHRPDGLSIPRINESEFKATIEWKPNQKFYQNRSSRQPINNDGLCISLTHDYSPKGLFGNDFTCNLTSLSIKKRFWFSAFGFIDIMATGAHSWSVSPFTALIIPNANLSYIIQPETYALLNPMEFILDSYASLNVSYHANGAILNNIPGIKRLKLREVFEAKAFIGHLSQANNPAFNPSLPAFPAGTHTLDGCRPYVELSAGIDNIFSLFRIEYVWRLTYLHFENIDKSGIRVGMKFHF
ncbi:MAG: hypothetical protein K2H61_02425 [Muribaculaceae bacterium]|nr:hypothetical protein [Muribaculaceae bacterium]